MQLSVNGLHVEVGNAYQTRVQDALEDLQKKYQIEIIDAKVQLSKGSHDFTTEITAHIGRGVHMKATDTCDDAFTSVDGAAHKLDTRLRRHKKRLTDHHRKRDTHHSKETAAYYVLNAESGEETQPVAEDLAPPIIAETETDILTLSVGDAVMCFDLSDKSAFLFKNSSTGNVNMLYRRNDGNIGWVEAK